MHESQRANFVLVVELVWLPSGSMRGDCCAARLRAAWKKLFSHKLNESIKECSIDVDGIEQSSHNPQYVCRKCFSGYERSQH